MNHLSVSVEQWRSSALALRDSGADWFGLLVGVDLPDTGEIELVLAVGRSGSVSDESVTCRVDRRDPRVDTLADVWAGAEFAEREVAEMLGVVFIGHPDPRPLLLAGDVACPPLRRDAGLGRRAESAWPGSHEPGEGERARRRPTRAIASDPADWSVQL